MQKEALLFYQKYRILIFPSIVALSAIILLIFVIYPQAINLLNNQKKSADIIKKSDFLQTKVQALESYDENDLKNKVSVATFSYPVDKDLGIIVGLLQDITSKSGFSITALGLTGGGSSNDTEVQSYGISLELTGSEGLLATLLKNLENSSRLLRVSSIETSISKDKIMSVNLSIEALYLGAPGDFGSIDSPLPEITSDEQDLLTKLVQIAPVSSQISTSTSTSRGKSNPFE